MNIPIERLFNKNRLDGSILQLLLLFFYTPIGVVLMIVRLFISLQLIVAVRLLPKRATLTRLMVRCLCGVLGLVVRQENLHKNPLYEDDETEPQQSPDDSSASQRRLVVISNHETPFDHFALSLVMPCVKLSCNGEGVPWPLSTLLGVEQFNILNSSHPASVLTSAPNNHPRRDEAFVTKINTFLGSTNSKLKPPLLLFPEDATTNGTSALMKYPDWSGTLAGDLPSVVCLKVKRLPPLPLRSAGVINSTFTQHLLTLFFCPVTIFTVKYLGRVPRNAAETDSDFSVRLQDVSAKALGVQTSNYDAGEKIEYVKRCLAVQQSQWNNHNIDTMRPELGALASQVQEVMPHLALSDILRDIAITRDVDVTITNFLEGTAVINYTPLPPLNGVGVAPFNSAMTDGGDGSGIIHNLGASLSSKFPINLSTKASSFPASASQRMVSYHDRKNMLIENALRSYVEKFGLHSEKDPYINKITS